MREVTLRVYECLYVCPHTASWKMTRKDFTSLTSTQEFHVLVSEPKPIHDLF